MAIKTLRDLTIVLITAGLVSCGGGTSQTAPPQAESLNPAMRQALNAVSSVVGEVNAQASQRRNQAKPDGAGSGRFPSKFSRFAASDAPPGNGSLCSLGGTMTATWEKIDQRTFQVTDAYDQCTREGQIYSLPNTRMIIDGTRIFRGTDSAYTGNDPINDSKDHAVFNPDRIYVEDRGYSLTERDASRILYQSVSNVTNDFRYDVHPPGFTDDRIVILPGLYLSDGKETHTSVGKAPNDPSDDEDFETGFDHLRHEQHTSQYGTDGQPHASRGVTDGGMYFTDKLHPEQSYSGKFHQMVSEITGNLNAGDDVQTLKISGAFTPTCLGARVTVVTRLPIEQRWGSYCPTGGQLALTLPSGPATVTYTQTKEIEVDLQSDGVVDLRRSSCTDVVLGTVC